MKALGRIELLVLGIMLVMAFAVVNTCQAYADEDTTYVVSIEPAEGGSITFTGGEESRFREGETVRLVIDSDEGSVLDQEKMTFIKGDGDPIDPGDLAGSYTPSRKISGNVWSSEEYTFIMPASGIIFRPVFKAEDLDVMIGKTIANGTVTCDETAHFGDTVTVTVSPEEHYVCTGCTYVVEKGKYNDKARTEKAEQTGENQFRFTMPSSPVQVKAAFALVKHKYTLNEGFEEYFEGITVSDQTLPPDGLITYGDTVTVKAKSAKDHIIKLVVKEEPTGAAVPVRTIDETTYSFKMPDSDVMLSAGFEECVTYVDERGEEHKLRSGEYTVVNHESVPDQIGSGFGKGFYVVIGKLSYENRLTVTDTSNIILCNNSTLTLNGGIRMATYNYTPELHIWGQALEGSDTPGRMIAKADDSSNAGIGGNDEENNGEFYLHGGAVEATGGKCAAGLGGGEEAGGGKVYVYGGELTATGGDYAAGIGGGQYGTGAAVVINGGKATATGGEKAAGIGGGEDANGGKVVISGGTVLANGGEYAAGIGGGEGGSQGGSVVVNDGMVTARGGEEAAGIGGGQYSGGGGNGGDVRINGGTVWATASVTEGDADGAQAIGCGGNDDELSSGNLSVYDQARVDYDPVAGENFSGTVEVLPSRADAEGKTIYPMKDMGLKKGPCRYINVKISPCEAHECVAYQGDEADQHELTCKYCGQRESAEEHDYDSRGVCTVCGINNGDLEYIDENGEEEVLLQGRFTDLADLEPDGLVLDDGWYVVRGDMAYLKRITVAGDVRILLTDGSRLSCRDGIRMAMKESNPELSIYGQTEQTGYLYAGAGADEDADGDYKAGIGGDDGENNGIINVYGGKVQAEGGHSAAGIGGGREGACGKVNIYNGSVTATGGKYGAGIGSGKNGKDGGSVHIYGGRVNAVGGAYGAGIGGGQNRTGPEVIIEDDEDHPSETVVTATGGTDGAGIGGGEDGAGGKITVKGGIVTAAGRSCGAGIGGGEDGEGADVKISGGTVEAIHGMDGYANAIGGGDGAHEDTVGTVELYDEAMVQAGNSASDCERAAADNRGNRCHWASYAKVSPCDHEGTPVLKDGTGHWHDCGYCLPKKAGFEEHEYEWLHDEEQHWQKCSVCEYETDKEDHAIANQDKEICLCGEEMAVLTIRDKDNVKSVREEYLRGHVYTLPEDIFPENPEGFTGWFVKYDDDEEGAGEPKLSGDKIELSRDVTITAKRGLTWKGLQDQIDLAKAKGDAEVSFTLSEDLYASERTGDKPLNIPTGLKVTLELKGHKLDRNQKKADQFGYVAQVRGELLVKDDGLITGGYGNDKALSGGVYVGPGGKFTMEAGTISGNRSLGDGGGLTVRGGTVSLSEDVKIENNYGYMGGGIYMTESGSQPVVTLNGTKIRENNSTGDYGGGVYVEGGDLKIGGDTVIQDNTSAGFIVSNVYLQEGKTIAPAETGFGPDAVVGVRKAIPDGEDFVPITTGLDGYGSPANFRSDDAELSVGTGDAGQAILGREMARVSFAPGDGAGTMEPVQVIRGSCLELPGCSFTPPEGMAFDTWTLNGEPVAADRIPVNGDIELKAVYRALLPEEHLITVAVSGEGKAFAEKQAAAEGETVALTAEPGEGQQLKEWKITAGEDSGCQLRDEDSAKAGLTMGSGDVTVTAFFEEISVEKVKLNEESLTMQEGDSEELTALIIPADAPNQKVIWSSSDEEVATVDGGKVTAVKGGTAVITAASAAAPDVKAECQVMVQHKLLHVEHQAPTCEEKGHTEYYLCENCSRYFSDAAGENEISEYGIQIPETGHDWGAWEITPSTIDKEGTMTRKCSRCEGSQEQTISRVSLERLAAAIGTAARVSGDSDIRISEDGSDVLPSEQWMTQKDHDTLKGAITERISAASQVLSNGDATQEMVNRAAKALEDAAEDYERAKKPGSKEAEPDPTPDDRKGQMGKDGTAFGPGASIEAAEAALAKTASDKDPAGTRFAPLMLKSTKQTKSSIKLTWKGAGGAVQYLVYGNLTGKANKMKRITTLAGSKRAFSVTKAAGKKLKKGKYYKFMVIAIDKNSDVVSSSRIAYVSTAGSKKAANSKKVVVKAKLTKAGKTLKKYKKTSAIRIKAGKTTKLKASLTKKKKTRVRKFSAIRYESSNPKVATVTAKGKVKAVGKGTARIYVYAQNGIAKTVKVVVK